MIDGLGSDTKPLGKDTPVLMERTYSYQTVNRQRKWLL
jgi:hypothetical protein